MRFIRELSFNIEEAAKAIAKHQEWRASFLPNGYILESEISGELNAKKSYLQGQDRKGHPILLILGCKHVPNKEDFEEFKSMHMYFFGAPFLWRQNFCWNSQKCCSPKSVSVSLSGAIKMLSSFLWFPVYKRWPKCYLWNVQLWHPGFIVYAIEKAIKV